MNIIIIEDEKPLADDLSKTILAVEPGSKIRQVIHSVEEGIEYLKEQRDIDLIFSDIQLGDGLSFEIFKQSGNNVPVIFCTAYNHYMLQAFESMGIHYIIKPFSKDSIAAAIQKFKVLKDKTDGVDFSMLLKTLKENVTPVMPSAIIHQADKIVPLSGNDIAFFYIEKENLFAYTFNGKKWRMAQKMDTLESKFYPFFYRTNRQYLVNRKAIKSVSRHFHRKMAVVLTLDYPETILIGKEKTAVFLDWLSNT